MEDSARPDASGNALRIVVRKGQRKLELMDGTTVVASMPVALGFGVGPKRREGDGGTPEGVYRVCVKNPKSKYNLALGLDYPNAADAARGLVDGIINTEEYERIAHVAQLGTRPPWDTALGGEIMIHGGGTQSDWTAGCIAVEDDRMDFLFPLVDIGTLVEIFP